MRKRKITRFIAGAMAAALAFTGSNVSSYASSQEDYLEDYVLCDEVETTENDEIDSASGYKVLRDENGKVYDLGGINVVIRGWWDGTVDSSTAYGKAYNEHKKWVEETYNFTIESKRIGDWGSCFDDYDIYVVSGGDSENYLFALRPDSGNVDRMKNGYFYDLSTLDCLDFSDSRYTKNKVAQSMGLYGMLAGSSSPKAGVIFNKTLLEKVGVDVDSIYQMQKKGTWTWSEFEKLIDKVQKYSDSNPSKGIIAFDCNEGVFTQAAMYSNTGYGLVKKGTSKFELTLDDQAIYDAVEWSNNISKKYTPYSGNETWDYYQHIFQNGMLAFTVDEEYCIATNNVFEEKNVKGDIGFVAFPKGPNMNTYVQQGGDNFYVIPACYSADKAWKIAFAYNVLNEPIKGYENYYSVKIPAKDSRIVNETIPTMTSGTINYQSYIDSFVGNSGMYFYWLIGPGTTANLTDIFSDAKAAFQPNLDSANAAVANRYNYKIVKFDNNGHGQKMNTRYVYAGKNYSFRGSFDSNGYIFGGWYTDKACTTKFNGTVSKNMTLYAKWTACKHTNKTKTVTKATTKADGKIEEKCKTCKAVVKKTLIPRAYIIVNNTAGYTGNAVKPTVKVVTKDNKAISTSNYTLSYSNNINAGKASVTVKFKGNYSGKESKSFVIVNKELLPDAVSKLTLSSASKGFKANWSPAKKNVKGYELQYSKDKNFVSGNKTVSISSGKKTATVNALSAKTAYYVRIRTYNTVGKNKVYSKWSKAVKVITK